ncbi:PAS domain S-box protein [Oxalobacteraceae sp. CFBP 8763]|nr:PAS domain S-box protein [Oxalobacteraceae sp. CFBP 8763]
MGIWLNRRRVFYFFAAIGAIMLIVASGRWAERLELEVKTNALRQAAAAQALGLRGLVEKHDFLPHAAARHPDVRDLLRAPKDAMLRSRVNDYFADMQRTTGASALYLINDAGLTIATSNWNLPSSFLGHSYHQRPYFEDAMRGKRGIFYGLGMTTGQSGLFIAEPVTSAGKILGVVVVKISLEPLQSTWIASSDPVMLRDRHGIVFLSSIPDWLFHSTSAVSATNVRWIAEHVQYGDRNRFDVLPWRVEASRDMDSFVLRTTLKGQSARLLAVDTPLPELGWTLTVTSSMKEVIQAREAAVMLTALIVTLVFVGTLYWRLRENRFAEQQSARVELERRVEERTRDLQKVHAFQKAMENSLLVGMRARDPEGKIIYVNPSLCAMTGYSTEELLGCRPPYPYWHPDDLEKQARESAAALQGQATPHGFESRIRHKDGHDVITMVYTAPLVDAQGLHCGWMSSVVDITEQKQAEARQREQDLRLQRSARLASIGEIASTLAHELNQPLMALSNFAIAARALAAQGSSDMLAEALNEIVGQSTRASEIVKRVRTFINPQRALYEKVSILTIISHAETLLKPELQRNGAYLTISPSDCSAVVRGDQVLLEQVIVNLIHNAVQAICHLPTQYRCIELAIKHTGQAVRLTVSDQGPGIPIERLDQVFTPFYTSKPNGLGLGLSICRTIVEAHGGTITAENCPGRGTAFSVTLPTV